jgi:hypothetical protein
VYDPEKNNAVLIDYGLACSLVKIPSVSMCTDRKVRHPNIDIAISAKLSMGLEITEEEWTKNDFYELGATIFVLWSGGNFIPENLISKKLKVIPKNIRVLIGKLISGNFRFSESESFV